MHQNDGECTFHSREGQNEPPLRTDRLAKIGKLRHRECTYQRSNQKHNENFVPVLPELPEIDHFREGKEDEYRSDVAKLFGHLVNILQPLLGRRNNRTCTQLSEKAFALLALFCFHGFKIHVNPCLGGDDGGNECQNTAGVVVFAKQVGGIPFDDESKELPSSVGEELHQHIKTISQRKSHSHTHDKDAQRLCSRMPSIDMAAHHPRQTDEEKGDDRRGIVTK